MRDFKTLQVWEKAHTLTLQIYRVTNNFPKEEQYGMTSQMRRAASSIPANIAEGCGRSSDAELARFLHISMGSASELEYFLLLARDLDFMSIDSYAALYNALQETKRMLNGFIQKVKSDQR